jgi:hypothetical protein
MQRLGIPHFEKEKNKLAASREARSMTATTW